MQVPPGHVEKPIERSQSVKRTDSSLTPPKIDDKKSKMADESTPSWVEKLDKLASKEDIKAILDTKLEDFKQKCFEPFKSEVLERVTKMESEVGKFPAQLKSLEEDFKQSLDFNSNELDKKVQCLEKDNKSLHAKVNELQDLVHKQNRERIELKNKMVDLEDRSRRDNLVIEGIPDCENETKQVCENKTRKFLNEKLQVKNSGKMALGRVHRIGPYKKNQTRSTIIKFDIYKQRDTVWEGRKNLPKGSRVRVRENFSKETESARAQLAPIMRIARKKNYYARLETNRLIVRDRDRDVNVTVTIDTLDKLPSDLKPEKIFTPTRSNVTLFYSKHSPHSNFYIRKFTENGNEYCCVEQYLVHKNALAAGDTRWASRVMTVQEPSEIKSMGKSITNIENDTRMENMKKGMLLKYSQHQDLLQKLGDTEGTTLAEANPHDKFWGIGLGISDDNAFDPSKWNGDNITGKLAMEVRRELCDSSWSDNEGEGEAPMVQ